ncbi:MAG: AgmX/PglI C-terminal domain-containing protein [Sandaracinaceae bacterium]
MKTRTRRSLALLSVLTLFGCDPTRAQEPDPVVDVGGTAGDEEEDEGPLPDLPNLADLSPGTYLFPTDALGAGETYLRSAQLIGTDADAFVIAIDDAPHRRVARRDAWPMACLTRAARFSEGDLRVTLDAGAPVFVLASSTAAARVSVALDTEHSVVVPRSALAFDACAWPDAGEAERRVPRAPEGDAVCLFADQESIDGTAGLVVPTGAPLELLEADGDWARARVSWPGGRVEGWVDATLPRGETERPDWLAAALARGFCLYPGRPTGRPWAGAGPEAGDPDVPSLPPAAIERVVRQYQIQIQACYEARLEAVPGLSVDLEVLLRVDADGHVDRAEVTRGASADEALTRCVMERVTRWRFPAPRHGSVQVRREFRLRPPEARSPEEG